MRRLLAAIAASTLLVVLSACAPTPPTESHSFTTADGTQREYLLTMPRGLPSGAPLVVMLHGGFGSADQAQQSYGWSELAATKRFAVAFPDGLGRAWNAGDGCCGSSGREGVDDVAFITELVASLRETYDLGPVYLTGMSNGAMMAYRLACDTDGVFAAIAPVAGTLLGDCADPAPIDVLAIHGLDDEAVRMDGEPGNGAERIDGEPIEQLHEFWKQVDGAEADAQLITVPDAGHQWPGSTVTKAQLALGADEPSDALDATAVIWRFFESH